jgi:hypothetical protein
MSILGDATVNKSLNCLSILALASTLAIAAVTAAAGAGPILVTNGKDSGEGSLRAALEALRKRTRRPRSWW